MRSTLEICCFSLASCSVAANNGADRIEFCSNPHEGGTTPSYGLIAAARKLVSIPLFPIIRPRGGDFLYDDQDFLAIKKDIQYCKSSGCEGVVIGLLNKDGSIDNQRLSLLVDLAYPLEVTFHRAFDRAANPLDSLEKIIDAGCQRILTSGQKPTADQGSSLLRQLIQTAKNRIIIMPGSGVRSQNILQLAEETGAQEFHTSARILAPSSMQYVNADMNEDLSAVECDGEEVRKIAGLLSAITFDERKNG